MGAEGTSSMMFAPEVDWHLSSMLRAAAPYAVGNPVESAAPARGFIFDHALNVCVFEVCRAPAIDQAVHHPDDKKNKDSAKHDVGKEMAAAGDAQQADAGRKRQGSRVCDGGSMPTFSAIRTRVIFVTRCSRGGHSFS